MRFDKILLIAIFLLPLKMNAQDTGSFTDSRDEHQYQWVKIGEQVWMAENLAWLPAVNKVGDALFEQKAYYVYGYSGYDAEKAKMLDSYSVYGTLYNWLAATEACPEGWHLPTDREWQELEKYLGMGKDSDKREWRESGNVGEKLKSSTGWITGNGTNEDGFSAIPAGCRGYQGFQGMGYCVYFWTASAVGSDNGWRRGICGDEKGICKEEDRKYFGISVRCVKNQ